jgi:phosphate starvation-inducible PhoH-like protein
MAKRSQAQVVEERWVKKADIGRVLKPKFQDENYLAAPVSAKNDVQKLFLNALKEFDVVVFSAPAGVGKSYLTMSEVSDWLKKGVYNKITLSRAVIPMGRSLGMLPSTLQQKFEPFLMPLLEVLWKRYGKSYYENCLANGSIELLAPEYARGRSVSDVMIIDEVQCMDQNELYTMLTRMEQGSKLILIGDGTGHQTDIKGVNGIEWLTKFVEKNPELQKHIKVITATSEDIVRGGLCKAMVQAREKESK